MYKTYRLLRPLAVFAGMIGILQSLIWIAMSIMAILAYFCVFNFRGMIASLGTLTELTLFRMYFHGTCAQSGMPNIDYAPINRLNLMKPLQVHICMWIYFATSIFWLISSITLLTSVRYINLRRANCYLFVWIFLTLFLCILDLGLGVAFAIDYDTLRHEVHNVTIDENGNTANQSYYLLIAAKTASGIMMSITLRGYTIWLINLLLCIYFFTQTFKISDYNRYKAAIANPMYVPPTGTMQKKVNHPNGPYAEKNDNEWINTLHNYSYQPNPMTRPTKDYRKNQAAALFEERKRHYEAQQLNYLRYIDKLNRRKSPSSNNTALNSHMVNGPNSSKKIRDIYLPEPDYSPSSHRDETFDTRPPLRSALRSSRY